MLILEKPEFYQDKLMNIAENYQQQCLLLLDPFLRPFDDDSLIWDYLECNEAAIIQIKHPSIAQSTWPFLIQLDLNKEQDCNVLTHSIKQTLYELSPDELAAGKGRRFSGWLFSQASIERVASYLAKLSIQRKEDDLVLLRAYDPAVITQLLFLLDKKRGERVLGPVQSWCIIGGNGEFEQIDNLSESSGMLNGALGLLPNHYTELEFIAINNRAIRNYRQIEGHKNLTDRQLLELIMPGLKRAQQIGIKNPMDLSQWALDALVHHPYFDQHPLLQKKMNSLEYYQMVSDLDDNDWHQITKDCEAQFGDITLLLNSKGRLND